MVASKISRLVRSLWWLASKASRLVCWMRYNRRLVINAGPLNIVDQCTAQKHSNTSYYSSTWDCGISIRDSTNSKSNIIHQHIYLALQVLVQHISLMTLYAYTTFRHLMSTASFFFLGLVQLGWWAGGEIQCFWSLIGVSTLLYLAIGFICSREMENGSPHCFC